MAAKRVTNHLRPASTATMSYDESGSENLSDDESNFDEEEDDDEDDEEESLEKFNPNFNQLNMNMKYKPLMI